MNLNLMNANGVPVAVARKVRGGYEVERRQARRDDYVNLGSIFTVEEVAKLRDILRMRDDIPTWEGFWKRYSKETVR
jgi:hypothetical protein